MFKRKESRNLVVSAAGLLNNFVDGVHRRCLERELRQALSNNDKVKKALEDMHNDAAILMYLENDKVCIEVQDD